MDMAQRIRLARKQKGLTQLQLAALVGVSKGACGQWEVGMTSPTVENLSRLANILEVNFEWLATGRGDITPSKVEPS